MNWRRRGRNLGGALGNQTGGSRRRDRRHCGDARQLLLAPGQLVVGAAAGLLGQLPALLLLAGTALGLNRAPAVVLFPLNLELFFFLPGLLFLTAAITNRHQMPDRVLVESARSGQLLGHLVAKTRQFLAQILNFLNGLFARKPDEWGDLTNSHTVSV
ncbi:hypothetical protein HZA57_02585 [Candidatus Poribacteria bacterium]|nr:hypothetical protein [Candidatus Poribacteria bacterium]